jgi:hypothetical protein
MRYALIALLLCLTACSKRDIPSSQPKPALTAWVSASGESMLPTFPAKALVEMELVPYSDLKAGESVVFWDYTGKTGATFVHHRLVGKHGNNWIARGDNPLTNPTADLPWVTEDNYIARTTGRHAQFLMP